MISDVISSLNTSITLVTRLREISKNVGEAEFHNLLADLSNALGDAKLEVANLKEQVAEQANEIRALKAAAERAARAKPKLKWGCYEFEGEEGLFCTACYDTKGLKAQTNRIDVHFRSCPVCRAKIGAG